MLFNDIVFGPIHSRRFGSSLGINLLPLHNKICNFDCVYCECGWTDLKTATANYNNRLEVIAAIEYAFSELKKKGTKLDAITFAGNGEPTMHPDFREIMEATARLRDEYFPTVKIVVLSNSTLLSRPKVLEGLRFADLKVMKLDAGSDQQFRRIDQPKSKQPVDWYIRQLQKMEGHLWIQTIFFRGEHTGQRIDNTTPEEVALLIDRYKEIGPEKVMMYTIDRATPATGLEKLSKEELERIAESIKKAGIPAEVYY